jgi:hypothetical protein
VNLNELKDNHSSQDAMGAANTLKNPSFQTIVAFVPNAITGSTIP